NLGVLEEVGSVQAQRDRRPTHRDDVPRQNVETAGAQRLEVLNAVIDNRADWRGEAAAGGAEETGAAAQGCSLARSHIARDQPRLVRSVKHVLGDLRGIDATGGYDVKVVNRER